MEIKLVVLPSSHNCNTKKISTFKHYGNFRYTLVIGLILKLKIDFILLYMLYSNDSLHWQYTYMGFDNFIMNVFNIGLLLISQYTTCPDF